MDMVRTLALVNLWNQSSARDLRVATGQAKGKMVVSLGKQIEHYYKPRSISQ